MADYLTQSQRRGSKRFTNKGGDGKGLMAAAVASAAGFGGSNGASGGAGGAGGHAANGGGGGGGAAAANGSGEPDFRTALTLVQNDVSGIAALLARQKPDDVQELMQTARSVNTTVARVAQRTANTTATHDLAWTLVRDELTKLRLMADEYHALLKAADARGQLTKQLSSSRARRKFEQFNSSLLVEATIFADLAEDVMAEKDQNYQRLPSFEDAPDEVVEIADAEGQRLWVEQFGATKFMVDVNKVVQALVRRLNVRLPTAQRKILLQVLDPSNTGQVSSLRWSEFLKGFGPMPHCLHNLQSLLARPWFHGFLSHDDSTKLLEVEPVGTFLIRFSSTRAGSFALAHTMEGERVNHVIIETRGNGFAIREDNSHERLFPSLPHLIEAYAPILIRPYAQTFPRQVWWHGDLSGEEAAALLEGKKPGTFLIRFSSQRGCFASSYVDANSNIEKGLIMGSAHGYQLSGKLFRSIEEIIDSLVAWNIFSEPYKNTRNEVNDKMRHKIVGEIVSTERFYVRALEATATTLQAAFKSNAKVAPRDTATIFGNVDKLLAFHRQFAATLERLLAAWHPDDTAVGPHFLVVAPQLPHVYAPYVNNFNASRTVLDRLAGNSKFDEFVRGALKAVPEDIYQNSLHGFLIMPVQRVPRYILLLSDLVKHTSGAHADYDALCEARDAIKKAADAVNEAQRAVEDVQRIAETAKMISGLEGEPPLAVMGRRLVKEGRLTPLENGSAKSKDYYCFLFSDMLLIAKRRSEKKFTYRDKMMLHNVKVLSVPDSGNLKNMLRFTGIDSELQVCADSAADKEAWMTSAREVLAVLNPHFDRGASMSGRRSSTRM